ncbi:glycoside hydrolase [Acidobacteria bacterium AB60]|nr:glycoside hydrolase [Acidobacteria bacterium AB60]
MPKGLSLVVLSVAGFLSLITPARSQPDRATADGMPDLHWRMIGPFRGGRTRAATGVPGQPNVFYVGQVNGGVWRSDDFGRTWVPIFDGEGTQSIGAIAVAASDPKIIYVASGEGLHRPDLSVGDGIYRSADAGKTWEHLGLREGQQIPALVVDPANPDRLFAAVLGHPYGPNPERGIYRSQDGGKTWEKVLYKGDRIGGSDVVLDPRDPNTIYVSLWEDTLGPWEDGNQYAGTGGGLFKSTDGGTTWKQLKAGLPENLVQINVALAASDPQRLYATLSTMAEGGYGRAGGLGFYRSDDAGETWRKITDDPRPALKIGGGDLPVPAVDPQNPDVVYSASIVTERSTDGGKTWMSLRGAPGGDDYQNLWINPHDPRIILLVSDQGALVTVNGGATWSSWYNQPTAQLYHVAATNTFPYQVCAGQQESGSVCTSTRGNDGAITFREWHPAGIIEYGYAAPDPLHPGIVYGAGRTEVSRYDSATGEVQNVTPLPVRKREFRADRTEPILFSPIDPHVMYYAASRLFKTTDYGHSWQTISPDLSQDHAGQPATLPPLNPEQQARRRGAIYAVAASYKNSNTLWAGTDDGLVWITRDGGTHWQNITPPGVTPWSKIAQVDASRFDDDTAYVAVNRMRIDDWSPHAFKTHDGGKTWTAINAGLPEGAPVDAVRADPVQPGLLYAATERAVWTSLDDGASWLPLQYNLPHTSMRDLLVHEDDLVVATHGRSFWVLDDIAPLRELAANKGRPSGMLLKPAAAWRVRRDNYTDTPLPADEPMGENPPDGALIDFALPKDVTGPVTLEILDKGGALIRRYTSNDPVKPGDEELHKDLIPSYWPLIAGPLPATPGMHRWVWDLRATKPASGRYEYPIAAVPHRTPKTPQGPLVLAGTYTVRLTVSGKSETQPITIKMDPRVHTTAPELEKLHAEQVKMASALDALSKADLAAHAIAEQLGQDANKSVAGIDPFVAKAKELIAGAEGKGSAPGGESEGLDDIAGEAGQIYGELAQSDEPPTVVLLTAAAHVTEEEREILPKWKSFLAKDLPALNRLLQQAGRPAIDLGKEPEDMPDSGDED